MAVIAVASAKGAPGASTALLGMALVWPGPVVVIEADPAGGSPILAGYLRGTRPNTGGVIDLALAHGLGEPPAAALDGALQTLAPDVRFLPGPAAPEQAIAAAGAWEPLGEHLRTLPDLDVLIDYGRPGAAGAARGLLRSADLVLLALRRDLPGAAAARAALPGLRAEAAAGGAAVESLLIGGAYSNGEVAAALGAPAAAALPHDPAAAASLSHGAPRPRTWRRFEAALRRAAADVAAAAGRSPALHPPGGAR